MSIHHLCALLLFSLHWSVVGASTFTCFDGTNHHFMGEDTASGLRGKKSQFEFCQQIEDGLFMYYTPQFQGSNKVLIGLHAVEDTFGWTALAIGGNGGMKGASQIVVRRVDDQSNGTWVVEDRNSQNYVAPSLDKSQDLELVFAEQTAEGETAWGVLIPYNSYDEFDYTIHNVTVFMHWAFGQDHTFSFHGKNRGQFHANLLMAPPQDHLELAGSSTMDFLMPNVTVEAAGGEDPANPYWCTYLDLEQLPLVGPGRQHHKVNADDKLHAVHFEPVFGEESKEYVHHMVLFSCNDDLLEQSEEEIYHNKVIPGCWGMTLNCQQYKIGWAVGVKDYSMPPDVGLPLGEGSRWLLLQTHYFNPGLDTGVLDSSGLRLHVAPELRTHDAGNLLLVGAIHEAQHPNGIPAGEEEYELPTFVVPSGCTRSMWQEPINLLAVANHMHLFGTRLEIEIRRDGESLGLLRDEKHFDIIHQSMEAPLVSQLLPGDEIFMRCHFNTSGSSHNVSIGENIEQEMCLAPLQYWPRQKLEYLVQYDPSPIIEHCQTAGLGAFANSSRCAQDFMEDVPRFLQKADDYLEPFGALHFCNSGIYEDDILLQHLGLCPMCYMTKSCTAEEVAAHAQEKVCVDYCARVNVSVYPDLSGTDGFRNGIAGCSGHYLEGIDFFTDDLEVGDGSFVTGWKIWLLAGMGAALQALLVLLIAYFSSKRK